MSLLEGKILLGTLSQTMLMCWKWQNDQWLFCVCEMKVRQLLESQWGPKDLDLWFFSSIFWNYYHRNRLYFLKRKLTCYFDTFSAVIISAKCCFTNTPLPALSGSSATKLITYLNSIDSLICLNRCSFSISDSVFVIIELPLCSVKPRNIEVTLNQILSH